jgi:hypothetical protein
MSSSKKLTCKGTLRQVFIGDYRLEIQSFMFLFSTQLCELLPLSNVLSGSPPPPTPPLPCVKVQYIQTMCGKGRFGGVLSLVGDHIFCRSLTLCIWPDSEPTKSLDHPKQKPRWGGGLRQTNTCRKVPLQVNFLDADILHCFLSF